MRVRQWSNNGVELRAGGLWYAREEHRDSERTLYRVLTYTSNEVGNKEAAFSTSKLSGKYDAAGCRFASPLWSISWLSAHHSENV